LSVISVGSPSGVKSAELILLFSFSADGFINGLAAVTQDALELSSSDVFLLAVVYEAKSGKSRSKKGDEQVNTRLRSKLLTTNGDNPRQGDHMMEAEAWKGGERALRLKRLRAAFDKKDTDGSGYLDAEEIAAALAQSGVIASEVRYLNFPFSHFHRRLVN